MVQQLEVVTRSGERFVLALPASGARDLPLALLGARAAETGVERAALLARGHAVVELAANAAGSFERLEAALRRLRDRGIIPRQRLALATGRSGATALQLATLAATPVFVQAGLHLTGLVVGHPEWREPRTTAARPVVDLLPFAQSGGRAILFASATDIDAAAEPLRLGYEALERASGGPVQGAALARLFVLPGADWHCDWLTHLERWLEQRPARPPDYPILLQRRDPLPERSVFAAGEIAPAQVAASRPVYPYPLRAIYKGHGDPARWQSWYAPAVYRRTPEAPRVEELPRVLPQDPAQRRALQLDASLGPVLVIGATGRLGQEVVRVLTAQGVTVRGFVRDAARAASQLPAQVELRVGDLRDPAAVDAAVRGAANIVFAASATAGGSGDNTPQAVEFDGLRHVMAAAGSGPLQRLLLVSSAACTQREHVHNLWGDILLWKARSEAALRASGLPYTILRPLGLRATPGGERGIRFAQGDRIAFGEEITRADTAQLIAAILGDARTQACSFEAYNDASLPPGSWVGAFDGLQRDAVAPGYAAATP